MRIGGFLFFKQIVFFCILSCYTLVSISSHGTISMKMLRAVSIFCYTEFVGIWITEDFQNHSNLQQGCRFCKLRSFATIQVCRNHRLRVCERTRLRRDQYVLGFVCARDWGRGNDEITFPKWSTMISSTAFCSSSEQSKPVDSDPLPISLFICGRSYLFICFLILNFW